MPPGQISPTEYQNTLNELNEVLASAHNPYKSCFDNTLAVLTLYLSPLVLGSHYERVRLPFPRLFLLGPLLTWILHRKCDISTVPSRRPIGTFTTPQVSTSSPRVAPRSFLYVQLDQDPSL